MQPDHDSMGYYPPDGAPLEIGRITRAQPYGGLVKVAVERALRGAEKKLRKIK